MASKENQADDISAIYSATRGIELPEKDIAKYMYIYLSPLFLIVATVGNIFTGIILKKLSYKVLSTCMYVHVACIMDMFVLYIRCGNKWLLNVGYPPNKLDVMKIAMLSSNSVCKLYPFIDNLLMHFCIWMIVAMAIESAMVSLRRETVLQVCKVERARPVILLITVLLLCINAHCFWTYALVRVEKSEKVEDEVCTNAKQGNHDSEQFRKMVWPIIDIIVADFLPYMIIFSCSVIMITKRVKQNDRVGYIVCQNKWESYAMDAASVDQIRLAFLIICVGHLIVMLTKMGYDVFQFLYESLELLGHDEKFSFIFYSRRELAEAICDVFLFTYLSCKFFVFLFVSRRFRSEVLRLLTCKPCRRKSKAAPKPLPKRALLRGEENHVRPIEEPKKAYAMTSV